MNFGEGGAGAYTDGKLGTRIHHPAVRKVVELFARFGGVARILAEGKPHVGSDLLPGAISAMREELERRRLQVPLGARASRTSRVRRRPGAGRASWPTARTLRLRPAGARPGQQRPRALRALRARAAGRWRPSPSPSAFAPSTRSRSSTASSTAWRSATRASRPPTTSWPTTRGSAAQPRGVFSFCMCPGGVVVPTPTEPGMQCTNGMSNSHRSSPLANAGMVVSVSPADFAAEGFEGPLAGLEWQRKWERAAFELGGGGYRAPAQRLSAYLAGRPGAAAAGAPATAPGSPRPTCGRSSRRRSRRRSGAGLRSLRPADARLRHRRGGARSGSRPAPAPPAAWRAATDLQLPGAARRSTPPARGPATPAASSRPPWTGCALPRPSASRAGIRMIRITRATSSADTLGAGAGRPSLSDLHALYDHGFLQDGDLVRQERSTQWIRAGPVSGPARRARGARGEPGQGGRAGGGPDGGRPWPWGCSSRTDAARRTRDHFSPAVRPMRGREAGDAPHSVCDGGLLT